MPNEQITTPRTADVLFASTAKPAAEPESSLPTNGSERRSTADVLYSDPKITLRPAITNRATELETIGGLTSASRTAFEQRAIADVAKSGMDLYGLGRKYYDALVDHELSIARGTESDPETIRVNVEQFRVQGHSRFGADFDDLSARAQKYIDANPRLAAIPGFWSRPEIALEILNHVRVNDYR